jgi:hypothetical protein
MKSLRIPGEIDKHNRLFLEESLDVIKPQPVEVDIIFLDDDLDDYREPSKAEVLAGRKEGLHDCATGNTLVSMSELWDRLGIKTTGEINEVGQLILDRPLEVSRPQYVDVVIWFGKNKNSQVASSEDLARHEYEVLTRELVTVEQK